MSEYQTRRTGRWRGVVAVALAALAAGLVLNRPDVLLLAVVGVVFAIYPQVTSTPAPSLSIDRRLSESSPAPGDEVEVTVTVQNTGDDALLDLRLVDGVPPALDVTEGSPRRGTVLRAEDSFSYTYTVTAARGKHRFDPATAVVRDVCGEWEVETTVSTETEVDCTVAAASAPLRPQTLAHAGEVTSTDGGSGVEFHRTREYRRGDAVSRIDWRRYARSGEPTTVEYRREQAVEVVLLVDARAVAYRASGDGPHAVAHSVSAARQLVETLTEGRNRVGVAGFGRSLVWVDPGASREHTDEMQEVLATHRTFASTPHEEDPSHDEQVQHLLEHLSQRAQVVLLSPLTDDDIVDTARTLDVRGHAVSVLSPVVTRDDTPERRLAAVERRNRVSVLRRADVPVVEWDPDRPLAAAITASTSGWSR